MLAFKSSAVFGPLTWVHRKAISPWFGSVALPLIEIDVSGSCTEISSPAFTVSSGSVSVTSQLFACSPSPVGELLVVVK